MKTSHILLTGIIVIMVSVFLFLAFSTEDVKEIELTENEFCATTFDTSMKMWLEYAKASQSNGRQWEPPSIDYIISSSESFEEFRNTDCRFSVDNWAYLSEYQNNIWSVQWPDMTRFPEILDTEEPEQFKPYPSLGLLNQDEQSEYDEMQAKIQKMLDRPCEEMRVIAEWEKPNEYTQAYDERYNECRIIETHEDPKLIKLNDTRHLIDIKLNNADVSDLEFSEISHSVILNLETLGNGTMSIKIPNELFPPIQEDHVISPMVLQDGEEIHRTDTSDKTHLILHFNFTNTNPTIEIIRAWYWN